MTKSQTPIAQRDLSLHQILVLCGNKEQRHISVLIEKTGVAKNAISVWLTKGIPYQRWPLIMELSGVGLETLARAQAFALDTSYEYEMEKYLRLTKPDNIDETPS